MQHLAISNDDFRLAWTAVEEASDLHSIDLRSGEAKQLTRNPTLRSTYPSFSPDGSKVVYSAVAAGADSGVWIIDIDGTNARAVEVGPGLKQHTAWLRDGNSVVWSQWSEGAALFRSSLITGQSDVMARLPRDASMPALSPDNQNVAFNRTIDGVASVWTDAVSPSTPRRRRVEVDGGHLARSPVWSPGGERLAVQVRGERGGSAVGVIELATSSLRLLTGLTGEAHPYAWSPDGRRIAFAGRRSGVWNIYAVSLDRREQRITTNESTTRWFRSPAWSPSGNTLVYEAGVPKANVWVSEPRVVD